MGVTYGFALAGIAFTFFAETFPGRASPYSVGGDRHPR